ncbi:MAG: glycosyltransferase family 39 protein [Acidobacteria bacterium]|nr:glycosyltransferase family 39 protein [Acidobacteriota bacterium]
MVQDDRQPPRSEPGRAGPGSLRHLLARHPLASLWVLLGIALVPVSAWALNYAVTRLPPRAMVASVFRPGDTTPVRVTTDSALDPAGLATAAGLDPRQPFIVEWAGLLVVEESGVHRLRLRVDDGAAMWVGDRNLIDRLAFVGEQQMAVPVRLTRGLHPFRLRYAQHGGEALLRFSWAQPASREEFGPVYAVASTDPPPLFRRIDKAMHYPKRVAVAWSLWILAGLAGAGVGILSYAAGGSILGTLGWRPLAVLLMVAAPIVTMNVTLGLHPWRGWVPDEVAPRDSLLAAIDGFHHGWYHFYPPLHFYILGLVNLPVTAMAKWNWLSLRDPAVHEMVHALNRGVTVVMAHLVLVGTALLAGRTVGARGRVLAPLGLLGIPLFAFYSKTSNVDIAYLFWLVVAALAFVRAMASRALRDHVLLGVAAAATIATKDQAYGFFPGAAIVLLWLAWRDTSPLGSWPARLGGTILDRRLWGGLLACLLVYSVLAGVWWNLDGVRAHVRLILGQGSAPFQMFPATPAGVADLAATTLTLLGLSVGPLVAVGATLGLGAAISALSTSTALLCLAILPVSYLLTFVGVVGYVYDRFLLGVVLVVVLFAARGFDSLVSVLPSARARQAATAALVVMLLAPAVALNIRLAGDTRVQAETWMQANLPADPLVLGVGTAIYLPNLYPYQHRLVPRASAAELLEWAPDAIVFNQSWFGRPGQPSESAVKTSLTEAGYVEQFVAHQWNGGVLSFLASGLFIDPVYSNVGKVGASISVWVRAPES